MAGKWCLTKIAEEKLIEALKADGDPQKMVDRGSEGRLRWFADLLGEENAHNLNALFEEKMLLKSQVNGFKSFIKRVGGSAKIQRDFFSKVDKLKTALSKSEVDQYIQDYVQKRLGMQPITEKQFKTLTTLSDKIVETGKTADIDTIKKMENKEAFDYVHNKETGKINNDKLMEYGRAVIALDDYRSQIIEEARMTPLELLKNPIQGLKAVASIAIDTSKASKASMDDSALLNQGFPILSNILTAKIWKRNALASLSDMVKTIGGKEAWNEIRAYAVSRPNYINGMYKNAKLAVMVTEEDFPTSLPEAILNLPQTIVDKLTPEDFKSGKVYKIFNALKAGKIYKASEVAFNGFQLKNRIDAFDLFLAISDKFNQKITTATVYDTGLGQLVNSLTSRGSLGKLEPVANVVNAPFFSLRKFVGTVDGFFFYQFGKKSAYVRGLGVMSRLQEILLAATILGVAKMLWKDSVEEDPTSADYGKIRIGDTRFTIDQKGSLTTLAMRILTDKYKSSTTGNISEINTGKFGSATSMDLLSDFAQNKLSPFLGQMITIINKKDREGNKPTVGGVLKGLYVPLGVENVTDTLNNPKAANLVARVIGDFFGINSNTYSGSNLESQYIPEGTIVTNESFLATVDAYAKANNIDNEKAFNKMFSGQMVVSIDSTHVTVIKEGEKIAKVSGGKIIAERMSVNASTAAKKAANANNPSMKLDHIIPLEFGVQFGGTNDPKNQKFVTTSDWSSWTKVENTLGKAIKNNKIKGEEAAKLITKLKSMSDKDQRKKFGNDIIEKYK